MSRRGSPCGFCLPVSSAIYALPATGRSYLPRETGDGELRMRSRNIYYLLKPAIPRTVRLALRRFRARGLRQRFRNSWPINEAAGRAPLGWPGWPDGKELAFVLTHDVEGKRGVARCRRLAELEMRLGFRSAFNFVPE